MFRKPNPEPPEVLWIKVDVSGIDAPLGVSPLTAWNLLAKKQRAADILKTLIDVTKEASDTFPPLMSVLGGVSAVIRNYEVLDE